MPKLICAIYILQTQNEDTKCETGRACVPVEEEVDGYGAEVPDGMSV